jgi:hypothetical protein
MIGVDLTIKLPKGKSVRIFINGVDTISTLKKMISKKSGIDDAKFRLSMNGKKFKDEGITIDDAGFKSKDVVKALLLKI